MKIDKRELVIYLERFTEDMYDLERMHEDMYEEEFEYTKKIIELCKEVARKY